MGDVSVEFDRVIPAKEIYSKEYAQWLKQHDEGLYFFYNSSGELLYIGWARDLTARIRSHLNGHSKNTKHFRHEISEIRILHVDSFDAFREKYPDCGDIEYYLIHHLNPKYNVIRPKEIYSTDEEVVPTVRDVLSLVFGSRRSR